MPTNTRGASPSSRLNGSQRTSSPLPSAQLTSKRKKRVQVTCPICEDLVEDASSKKKGHDAIFCDGACQEWLHRQCAGLSKVNFESARSSELPFLCPCCLVAANSKELATLKEAVVELVAEVSKLKSLCSSIVDNNDTSSTLQPSAGSTSTSASYATAASHPDFSQNIHSLPTTVSSPRSNHGERKFNLVIFGVNECTKGSPRDSRTVHDTNAVFETLKMIDDNISEHSIRDCQRLGKYSDTKHRPILAKLSRSCDVLSILSKRAKLADMPGISIKPDMSKEQRKVESVLLYERRKLIQSGIVSKCIRLKGDSLFVNNKKHGSVVNFKFNAIVLEVSTMSPPSTSNNLAAPASTLTASEDK